MAVLILIPMILPPAVFGQVVAREGAAESGRPPVINSFTVSALTGEIEANITFSSTGDGEIIQCEVMLGEVRGERLSIQNTRGGTICTGTFSVGRENYSLSDLSAYAVNSLELEDIYTPAKLKTTSSFGGSGGIMSAPDNRNENKNQDSNNTQRENQDKSNNNERKDLGENKIKNETEEKKEKVVEEGAKEEKKDFLLRTANSSAVTDTLPGGSDIQMGEGSIFSDKDSFLKKTKINSGIALGGIVLLGAAAVGGIVIAAGVVGAGALPIVIGGAVLGLGAGFFGLSNIDLSPYSPGKVFLEPREIGGKRDLSKEILALGKKNFEDKKQGQPYITGRKEIDMRSGVPNNGFGSIEIDNTLPKGLLTLEVNIDIKDPNGAYMYDTTTSINKSLNKNFLAKYEGEKLKNVWWEVSLLPFTNTCQNIKESNGTKIKDLTDGKQKYFGINFEDYFTPAMKNGVYNGPVTFYIHLVGEGYGSCKSIFSNTVTVVVNPDTNFVELVNKDAIRPILTTTGDNPKIIKGGEFTNENDSYFIDWTLEKEKQTAYFHLDKSQNLSQVGRWQVSVIPFKDNECIAPEGLVAQQNIDISSNRSFYIPFDTIALNKPPKKNSQPTNTKISSSPGFIVEAATGIASTIFNSEENDTVKKNNAIYEKYIKGKDIVNYYVRFIGYDPATGLCTTLHKPSNTVTVVYGKEQKSDNDTVGIEYHDIAIASQASFTPLSYTYTPANFPVLYTYYEPPAGHYVYIKSVVDFAGNVLVATNTKKFIPPPPPKPPKDFWDYLSLDNIIQSIKDFVEAVIKIVDFASNFYNGLKAGLTNLIAEGLSSIGIPCEATCKSVISSGLSIGQAALGIPPSIPNFDQLMDEGVDYLAKEAASQVSSATGLPLDEAAEYAVKASLKKTMKEVKEANTENKKDSPLFIIPDPDFQYKPGQFKIVLKNTGNDIGGGKLKVTFTENSSLIKTDLKNGRNFYSPIMINIPPLKKGETLTIPIILEENYKDYSYAPGDVDPSYLCTGSCVGIVNTPEYAQAAKWSRWMEVYKNTNITMTITTSVGASLPLGFDPKNYGFDTSKWKKISRDTWKDEKGVLHIFKPKENKDLNQFQTITKTLSAKNSYNQK